MLRGIEDLIASIQKQQSQFNSWAGIAGNLAAFAKSIPQPVDKFAGIHGFSDLARAVSQQHTIKKQFGFLSTLDFLQEISKKQYPVIPSPFNSNIQNIISQQRAIYDNFSHLSKAFSPLAQLQSLALNRATITFATDFLTKAVSKGHWKDIEVFEDYSEEFNKMNSEIIEAEDFDIEKFEIAIETILSKIDTIDNKTSKKSLVNALFRVFTVISLLLSIYGRYKSDTGLSNEELAAKLSSEIAASEKKILTQINTKFEAFNNSRTALTTVKLRYAPKKRSQEMGIVRKGQKVTVIDTNHKWIFIAYVDLQTNQPMSGWVYKKYFERIND